MTTTTQTLADFLLAAIAEDEATARAATRHERGYDPTHEWFDSGRWRVRGSYGEPAEDGCRVESEDPDAFTIYDEGGHSHEQAVHIARYDPAHVLAVCAAHRAIVELHSRYHACAERPDSGPYWGDIFVRPEEPDTSGDYCPTLRALATAYADRPGFREEWKP